MKVLTLVVFLFTLNSCVAQNISNDTSVLKSKKDFIGILNQLEKSSRIWISNKTPTKCVPSIASGLSDETLNEFINLNKPILAEHYILEKTGSKSIIEMIVHEEDNPKLIFSVEMLSLGRHCVTFEVHKIID